MKLKNRRPPITDLFFTLGVFCVFTVCALLVVAIGLRAYRGIADDMQDTYSTRTALAYVVEKVRQHDTADAAALTEWESGPALVFTDTTEERTFYTYVYADAETLYELTVPEGTAADRTMGEAVLAVRDFSMRDEGNGLWAFTAADSDGRAVQCFVRLRSEN